MTYNTDQERKIVERVIDRLKDIVSKEPFLVRDRVKEFISKLEDSLKRHKGYYRHMTKPRLSISLLHRTCSAYLVHLAPDERDAAHARIGDYIRFLQEYQSLLGERQRTQTTTKSTRSLKNTTN